MTHQDVFDSSIRSKGDMAGVFEYDGDSGYFYLFDTKNVQGHQVVGAIRILIGEADVNEADISIRWDSLETRVGLFIQGQLIAAFDIEQAAQYGGAYHENCGRAIPLEVLKAFE